MPKTLIPLPRRAFGAAAAGRPSVLRMARKRTEERRFPVAAQVPESQIALIQAHAGARGMTVAELIRHLLTKELGVPVETELERNRRLRGEQLPQLAAEALAAAAATEAAEPRQQMIA